MYPSLEQVKKYAESGEYKIMPISMEMLSDIRTPIETMRIFMNKSKHCYMLESAGDDEKWGRYTFLGFNPKMNITCLNGRLKVNGRAVKGDPKSYIHAVLDEYKSPRIEGFPTFTGGLVGYFSYDFIKYSEPSLDLDAKDEEGFKDLDLMLFDKVVAFDNFRHKIILIVNIRLDDAENEYERAETELKELSELIRRGKPKKDVSGRMLSPFRQLFSEEEYCDMIERAKKHIFEGDIFQIVPSNRFDADYEGHLFNTYRLLRTINPSPYMFYFSGSDMEVAGASPETLVKLENGILHTFPLAGSRPRGKTEEEDKRLEEELLADPKELAEHNMLVDLGRNDLGKISKFGSVKVENYHRVLRFSHIMHIGSTIRGELAEGKGPLDAVEAVLPAGTLSGAPKIMACRLINELEVNKRGIYGGALGYVDFTGNLDMCIAIRLAYKKNGKVFVRSGAGIVADSVPQKEYRECVNKAAAVIKALKESEGEL